MLCLSGPLLCDSSLSRQALIIVGIDHWLADLESLTAMPEACNNQGV